MSIVAAYEVALRFNLGGDWKMEKKLCVAGCMLLLFSGRAWAFKPTIHEEICQDILPGTTRTVDGENLSFTEKAIVEIRKANRKTDESVSGFLTSYKHFDGEEFSKSSQHLITKKEDVISKITASSPNGEKARESLGIRFRIFTRIPIG